MEIIKNKNNKNAIDNKGIDTRFNYNFEDYIINNEQNTIYRFCFFDNFKSYQKCVCKIQTRINNSYNFGTGFFCYFPIREIRVLITNNHNIDQNFLDNEKELIIYLEENGKQQKKIFLFLMK